MTTKETKPYASFQDWFNEVENYSLRGERVLGDFENGENYTKWLKEAWEQGRKSSDKVNVKDNNNSADFDEAQWLKNGRANDEAFNITEKRYLDRLKAQNPSNAKDENQ